MYQPCAEGSDGRGNAHGETGGHHTGRDPRTAHLPGAKAPPAEEDTEPQCVLQHCGRLQEADAAGNHTANVTFALLVGGVAPNPPIFSYIVL